MSKKTIAKKVGIILAHFQGAIDDAANFCFKKMEKLGKQKKNEKIETDTVKGKAKYAALKTSKFIGEAGKSFYEEYEELKRKKTSDK
ncbi:hypothetical protein KKG71_05905 [Patescibacteria group bacterium]|nr:hypothetical protein [Patescibacteria group bacterium]